MNRDLFFKEIIRRNENRLRRKIAKTFYNGGGFELTCEDGSYAIFPPEIVKKSVLVIHKKITEIT